MRILPKLFASAVIALSAFTAGGEVIADIDFTYPTDMRMVRILHAGNYGAAPLASCTAESRTFQIGPVEVDGVVKYPMVLYAGCNSGWNGAAIDFSACEIPESGTIRLTVWLKTNNPRRVILMATEGASVGGAAFKKNFATAALPYARHAVSVELGRFAAADAFSVGLYLDYNHGAAQEDRSVIVIDRILVEHLDAATAVGRGETAVRDNVADYPLPEFPPLYQFIADLFPGQEAE